MSAIDWQAVNDLFHAALNRDRRDRNAFLDDACGGNGALRAAVERLLRAHESASNVIDRSVAAQALLLFADDSPAAIGALVGRYRLLRELGRGGMGAVYLGERADDEFRKQVAVKLVKRGMDTDAVLRQFRAERQILAGLEHPDIARLIDGGTTADGLPYFIMEYVDGEPIDRYCDRRRLDVDERLALFQRVCGAVSYAHQRLVIHRDIKPSNILVTGDGALKLLDFGIAKIMDTAEDGERLATATALRPMTPEYASPEQLLGQRVDALSDVYSLGALLYELLSGHRPFHFSGRTPADLERRLAEEDPPRPSAIHSSEEISGARRVRPERLRHQLRGDLDTIVLRALASARDRRYQSVDQFAEDVRRHGAGLPIVAHQDTALYRAVKFARRNRAAVVAGSLVFATLIVGIAATAREAFRADRAERAAVLERDRAVAAERFTIEQRDRALAAEQHATVERERAEQERNNAFQAASRADTEAAVSRAVTEFLQDDLLRQASAAAQATPTTAPRSDLTVRAALDRAAAKLGNRFDATPIVEAAIRQTIGNTYHDLGVYGPAQEQMERALALRLRTLGPNHRDTLTTMAKLGTNFTTQGQAARGVATLTDAVAGMRRLLGTDHPDTLAATADLALAVGATGDRTRALALYTDILRVQRRLLGEEHADTLAVMNQIASIYQDLGQFAASEGLLRRVIDAKRRVLGPEHPSTLISVNGLGIAFRTQGKYAEAEPLLREVLDTRQRVLGPEHPNTMVSRHSLARVYEAQGKYALSTPLLVENLAARRRVLGAENADTLSSLSMLAASYRHQGRLADAEPMLVEALQTRRRSLPPNHPTTFASMTAVAELKLDLHDPAAAEKYLREAIASYERIASDTWQRFYAEALLGVALSHLNRFDEAQPLLESGYARMVERRDKMAAEDRPLLDAVKESIAQSYERNGQQEKALEWRKR
jgi:hypothetical protein